MDTVIMHMQKLLYWNTKYR